MIPAAERALLQVWWTDCTNVAGGWHDDGELAEFATSGAWECSNTGWLVHEDGRCYVLAGRMTDDGKHAGLVERIPKAAVTAVKTIITAAGGAPVPEPVYDQMITRDEDGPDPLVPEPVSTEAEPAAKKKPKKASKPAKAAKKGSK